MKILKIDYDVFRLGFEGYWEKLMDFYNNKGFDAMEFYGNLNLSEYPIMLSLPDNLTVNGDLDISYANISILPDNLTVKGNFDVSSTSINEIPDNLMVGGWLDLIETNVESIPDDVEVGGKIYGLEN